jgi:tRNA modification GTPase
MADKKPAIVYRAAMENQLLPPSEQTILACATPPGRAGVAVLRLSGALVHAVPAYLGCTLPEPRRAALVKWKDATGAVIDQGLMLYFAGPNSFTGEDVLELHPHGSMAVLEALQNHLLAMPNIRLAEPGEFSRRAYLNGKMDMLEAEGLLDLIHAETDAQRKLALAQMHGEQSRALQSLGGDALHALALLEACIDFPDEDIPPALWQEVQARVKKLQSEIARLIAGVDTGARVREGFRTVIVGPPNAGKSSLLNALSGQEAAITSPIAGTTRDTVEVRLQIAGQLMILADTAGLRGTEDVIEQEGVRRALLQQARADLRMIVLDGTSLPSPSHWVDLAEHLAPYANLPSCILLNKSDLDTTVEDMAERLPAALKAFPLLPISAKTGEGLDAVEQWMGDHLTAIQAGSGSNGIMLTRARHRQALTEAQDWLSLFLAQSDVAPLEIQCEQLRQAAQAIGKITGKILADDVLGVIFSEFCIGK